MIKQLLRQMWAQRRTNLWLWVILTLSCIVMWYAVDIIYNYEVAAHQPKGYDTDCVFDIKLSMKPVSADNADADDPVAQSERIRRAATDRSAIYNLVRDYDGIEASCCYVGTVPYGSTMFEGYCNPADSTHMVGAKIRYITPEFFDVFRLSTVDGRFDRERWVEGEYPVPVMMSYALADSLFDTASAAVGQTVYNPYILRSGGDISYRVMAVVPDHKLNEYERYEPFIYMPMTPMQMSWSNIAVRVRPEDAATFAERFMADMAGPMSRGSYCLDSVTSYSAMKDAYDRQQGTVSYLGAAYAVIAFFLFNVFLIVFGTFMIYTRRRRGEIALRMAMGCSRSRVMGQLMAEGMLLLAMALVPAIIIAANLVVGDMAVTTLIDMSRVRFVIDFAVVALFMAVVIVLGIYPAARRAMNIAPAVALHEE